jgi:magnesium transporter
LAAHGARRGGPDEPGLEHASKLLAAQPAERAIELLKAISADRRADIFRHLEAPGREQLLAELDVETKESLNQLLAYPENTAGSIMTTEFVSVPSTWTVGQALQHIRLVESTSETVYAIYLLDPNSKALVKAISLRRPDRRRAATADTFHLSSAPAFDRAPLTDRETWPA